MEVRNVEIALTDDDYEDYDDYDDYDDDDNEYGSYYSCVVCGQSLWTFINGYLVS